VCCGQPQDSSECGIDGSRRLKVVDGRKNAGGDVLRRRQAIEFFAQMLVTEGSMAGVGECSTAAAIGSGKTAATLRQNQPRNARAGSVRVARQAGKKHAAKDATIITASGGARSEISAASAVLTTTPFGAAHRFPRGG